jgi:putative ABC transport system substrate-binding protein
LGYVDGRNIKVEYAATDENDPEEIRRHARDLVRRQANVIFVAGDTLTALAARDATSTVPIVIAVSGDPVALGLVNTLARPGGNVTGVTYLREQIAVKGLELLKTTVPHVTRFAVLIDPTDPSHARTLKELAAAAQFLRVFLRPIEARTPTNFQTEFSEMSRDRLGGLVVLAGPNHFLNRSRITHLAVTHRLPAVSSFRPFAEVGGFLTYGPNARELLRRAATFVDRILKGARAGDLPIEQPTTFELIINLGTAKALGLTIPPAVLARADEVIE